MSVGFHFSLSLLSPKEFELAGSFLLISHICAKCYSEISLQSGIGFDSHQVEYDLSDYFPLGQDSAQCAGARLDIDANAHYNVL